MDGTRDGIGWDGMRSFFASGPAGRPARSVGCPPAGSFLLAKCNILVVVVVYGYNTSTVVAVPLPSQANAENTGDKKDRHNSPMGTKVRKEGL